jgi:hypothetical protein
VFFEEIFERSIKIKPVVSDPELGTRPWAEQTADSAAVKKQTEGASIEHAPQVLLLESLWIKPYVAYLLHGELPEDLVHHRQIIR